MFAPVRPCPRAQRLFSRARAGRRPWARDGRQGAGARAAGAKNRRPYRKAHFSGASSSTPVFSAFAPLSKLPTSKLTRIGATRLLDAIGKYDPQYLCKDWHRIKSKTFSDVSSQDGSNVNVNRREHSHRNRYSLLAMEDDGESTHIDQWSYDNYNPSHQRGDEPQNRHLHRSNENARNEGRAPNHQNNNHHQYVPYSYHHPQRHSYHSQHHPPARSSQKFLHSESRTGTPGGQERKGCYNCGEYNHNVQTCRFDHKLRCTSCRKLGHKSKLCRNYNF